ncbi:hypothetical protein Tco_1484389 [Tanacetum coccineum]
MRPAEALTSIQTMADHSQKWHDGTTSRNIGSSSSKDELAALVNKLDNLGRDMKRLKESVMQSSLMPIFAKDLTLRQMIVPSTRKFKHGIEDLVVNNPLTMENEDIRINRRCSTLLFNQLPPKEKDPGSFILPCSIGIGKLETIKMNIELADNSKCIPKGIASCNPSNEECDGGILRNNEIRCYWESENDNDRCGEGRNNEIQERVINNLHDEWFKRTSDDEDDIKGIIDYLEPTSYDGFIDLDEEEYNKRRCRLLGMSFQKLGGNYRDRLDSYSFGNLAEFAVVTA